MDALTVLGATLRVLMADGSTRELASLRPGDEIIGTKPYRPLIGATAKTRVLAHWETRKPGYRVVLEDGTELVASADHRFLTDRGWKHVAPAARPEQRPYLTPNNKLMGFGARSEPPLPVSDNDELPARVSLRHGPRRRSTSPPLHYRREEAVARLTAFPVQTRVDRHRSP